MWTIIVKTFLENYKSWLPMIIIGLLVLYHFSYVHILKSDIKKIEGYSEYQRTMIKDYEHNKTIDQLEIATLEHAKQELTRAIDTVNDAVEKIKVNEDALAAEVEKWKNKTPEVVVKYVDRVVRVKDKNNATCEEYKEANKNIAKIDYKGL
nr:MAG TPA: hypothetical protein [Caudoviricetes sp.]